jgi:hypothetical protein
MTITVEISGGIDRGAAPKLYQRPQLVAYGSVEVLTKSGASGTHEIGPNPGSPSCATGPGFTPPCLPQSDIRCKHNIVRMGTHGSGVGLYMYDYLPEFTARMGTGKFFGVMAQEVLFHNPSAVVLEASGYYVVNYAALESATVQ